MLLDERLVRILFEDSSAEARSYRPTSLTFRGDSVESLLISLLKAYLGVPPAVLVFACSPQFSGAGGSHHLSSVGQSLLGTRGANCVCKAALGEDLGETILGPGVLGHLY